MSRLAPLETVNWLIRNILGYVVFAAIVMFQSDIRRALAHFGRAPFFRYFNRRKPTDETIEEMVVAATMLAAQRIGAIIAIEREIGLRNYIESGIPLDAAMTYDLLVSDLPAVVAAARRRGDRAGRPHRGGGLLPAADGQPASQPGARHAAPRGHRPDRGERRRGHRRVRGDAGRSRSRRRAASSAASTADELRERLQSLISSRRTRHAPAARRRSTRLLMAYHPFRHLGLKVLAVALASVLWMTVAGEHVVERSLRVPLECSNFPTGLEIVGEPPATVDVRVRGSSAQLSRLDARRHRRRARSATARTGSRLFHLRTDQVRVPFGVEVVQVDPPTIALSTSRRRSRRNVPVVPAIDGEPAPGFVVGRDSAEPATVEVVGPESPCAKSARRRPSRCRSTAASERVRDA